MADNNDKEKRKSTGFSEMELSLMRERAKELKAEDRVNKNREIGERDVIAAIESYSEPDRTIAKKIHKIVKYSAPELMPRLWYGMPAYAKDGKVICFFQSSSKFKVRYSTFGFQPDARLDEGNMWPSSFAIIKLTENEEARIVDLVKRAIE